MDTGLSEPAPGRVWIGLDVGGTKIDAVAVDGQGQLRGHVRCATESSSQEGSVASIAGAIEAVMAEAGVTARQVEAVGVGIPGMVHDGVVSLAVNLNLSSFPLADYLTGRFGIPVRLENDVRAAALGAYAWMQGEFPAVRNMIYLSIGTGIACGVILDRRLLRGVNGMAGEIGHMICDPDGAVCKCGNRGCLETIASGPAIARQGTEAGLAGTDQPLTAEDVFAAARAGDAAALGVVRQAAEAAAAAIYNLLLAYDVDVLALGGGVSQAGEVLFGPVSKALERMADRSPLAKQVLSARTAPGLPAARVILLPADGIPAWYGMIVLAKGRNL